MTADTITIARVPNRLSPVKLSQQLVWEALTKLLSAVTVGAKDGAAWMPAVIQPGARKAERVEAITTLVLDIECKGDEQPPAPAEVMQTISARGWRCLLHTSYSHAKDAPRYRLAFAVERPLAPSELRLLAMHVANLLGLSSVVDTACMEPARLFYLPRCADDAGLSLFEFHETDGVPLEVDALLAEALAQIAIKPAQSSALTASSRYGLSIDAVSDLLRHQPDEAVDEYDGWLRVGMALHHEYAGTEHEDAAIAAWDGWSTNGASYQDFDEIAAKWASFGRRASADKHISVRTLMQVATANGWREPVADQFDVVDDDEPDHPPARKRTSNVLVVRGCDLTPEPIQWLWPGWLAAGKLHILGGAPGTGKTTLAMAMAATVTTGGRWPDETQSALGNIVIWSGEDDPKDSLLPRLLASGADWKRVHFVKGVSDAKGMRSFDPAQDMCDLAVALEQIGNVRLLIVDPIVSAVAGDSHKNAEVRRDLQPLVDLASKLGCALLGITHFSKGTSGREPTERITGSLAFGALARVVLVAAKKPHGGKDGNGQRVLLRAKSNIGADDGGFTYSLQQEALAEYPGVEASRVVFGGAITGAARDILQEAEADGSGGDALSQVERWLETLLSEEKGKLDQRDVMKAAFDMGFSKRTVQRAREKLELIVDQSGFGKSKRSVWKLPADLAMFATIVPCVPDKKLGTHGINGVSGGTNTFSAVENNGEPN